MIRRITSAGNELCRQVKKLLSQRAYRQESGLFVLEGRRLLEDALLSGIRPQAILLADSLTDEADRLKALCETVYLLPDTLLGALGDTKTPQGLLAVCRTPAADTSYEGERMLLLVSLQDPGNVGTIIRTAESLGASRVILTADCPEIYSPKVLRATMGGVFRLPITTAPDAKTALAALSKSSVRTLAAALTPDARPIGEIDRRGRVCVLIGNEGSGLSKEIISLCDEPIMIPMKGRAQSLNAAMAAGILLWELCR